MMDGIYCASIISFLLRTNELSVDTSNMCFISLNDKTVQSGNAGVPSNEEFVFNFWWLVRSVMITKWWWNSVLQCDAEKVDQTKAKDVRLERNVTIISAMALNFSQQLPLFISDNPLNKIAYVH